MAKKKEEVAREERLAYLFLKRELWRLYKEQIKELGAKRNFDTRSTPIEQWTPTMYELLADFFHNELIQKLKTDEDGGGDLVKFENLLPQNMVTAEGFWVPTKWKEFLQVENKDIKRMPGEPPPYPFYVGKTFYKGFWQTKIKETKDPKYLLAMVYLIGQDYPSWTSFQEEHVEIKETLPINQLFDYEGEVEKGLTTKGIKITKGIEWLEAQPIQIVSDFEGTRGEYRRSATLESKAIKVLNDPFLSGIRGRKLALEVGEEFVGTWEEIQEWIELLVNTKEAKKVAYAGAMLGACLEREVFQKAARSLISFWIAKPGIEANLNLKNSAIIALGYAGQKDPHYTFRQWKRILRSIEEPNQTWMESMEKVLRQEVVRLAMGPNLKELIVFLHEWLSQWRKEEPKQAIKIAKLWIEFSAQAYAQTQHPLWPILEAPEFAQKYIPELFAFTAQQAKNIWELSKQDWSLWLLGALKWLVNSESNDHRKLGEKILFQVEDLISKEVPSLTLPFMEAKKRMLSQ